MNAKYLELCKAMLVVAKGLEGVSALLSEHPELNDWIAGINEKIAPGTPELHLLPMSCDEYAVQWQYAAYEAETEAQS